MTKEKLLELIEKYEWNDFECKKASRGVPDDAYKSVSAFANTQGGWLVFGIKDSNGQLSILGVEEVDKVQNDFLSTLRSGEKMNRIITVKEEIIEHEGKTMLVFYVPESPRNEKPVYLKGDIRQSYIRKGSGDEQCTTNEIERFLRDSATIRYDSEIVENIPADSFFDEGTLRWYRERFKQKRPGQHESLSDLDFLIEWNYVVEQDEKLYPTRAAVLLFGTGRYVRQVLPQPILDYQRIDSKADDWTPEERWGDRVVFEENIIQTWLGLVEKYMRLSDRPFKIDPKTLRRDDDPADYVAFREAAINLLIHRDYGDHTRKAVIQFFTDRTRFWNPGDAFATDSELLDSTEKEVRNPMIVGAFRRIGMSDQAGSGIRAIFRNWHELGNVPPLMVNDKSSKDFELVLLKELLINNIQKRFQSEIGVHLSAQDADVFAYACENERISLLDVRKLTASTKAQAREIIDRLVVQVLLQPLDDNLYELTETMQKRYGHFVEIGTKSELSSEQVLNDDHSSTDEVTEVVGTKSALSRHQVSLLQSCRDEMAIVDLMKLVDRSDRTKFKKQFLNPLLDEELIEMTIPDKPTSSKQKYKLTHKGIGILEELQKDDR